jgi:hypothetical protein
MRPGLRMAMIGLTLSSGLSLIGLGAHAASTGACAPARAYLRAIQTHRYADISLLFAKDAVFLTPQGAILRGAKQIGDFYSAVIAARHPRARGGSFIEEGRECAMELQLKAEFTADGHVKLDAEGNLKLIPDGSRTPGRFVSAALDHFTVNAAGKFTRLAVYAAPSSYWNGE